MDISKKLQELQDLEKTLESQIERIYEAKEELNLKETVYKQQLHFVRGQIAILHDMEPTKPLEFYNSSPLNYKAIELKPKITGTEISPVKTEVSEHPLDPLDPFPQESKGAQIKGFQFAEI